MLKSETYEEPPFSVQGTDLESLSRTIGQASIITYALVGGLINSDFSFSVCKGRIKSRIKINYGISG